MMENSNYTEPRHVVKAFVELGLDRQSRILDILAGSGVVAEMVGQFYRLIVFTLRNVPKILVYPIQIRVSYVLAATPTLTLSTPAKRCWRWPTRNNFTKSSTFRCWEGSTKRPSMTVGSTLSRDQFFSLINSPIFTV
jgi:hypothetical protein